MPERVILSEVLPACDYLKCKTTLRLISLWARMWCIQEGSKCIRSMMVHGGWDYCSPSLFFCHVSYLCILGRENISPPYIFGYRYDLVTWGYGHIWAEALNVISWFMLLSLPLPSTTRTNSPEKDYSTWNEKSHWVQPSQAEPWLTHSLHVTLTRNTCLL